MQHIPNYRQFVNEGVNLKAAHLSSAEYQKAKKLKAFDPADWTWNSKSQLYDKVNESVVTEAKFTRLPKQLNAMWELKNSVENMVDKHDNGDDYNPNQMRTIEEFIKKIKKSAKSFKSKEEVAGTVYESKVNEGPGKGYYIKVSVRDAKKALAILDDMYRKKFDINGSNVYYFKDEDMAYDAMMDLSAEDIEISDTNIEESLDEKADPCWDDYKIGSPKTKISSSSGKRVNNCVPKDESVTEGTYNSKDHIGSTSDGQGSNAEIYKKGKGYYVIVSGEADYDFDAKNDKELLKKLKDNEFDSTDILEVNEATDLNDPVIMAIRRMKSEMEKRKSLPKIKKTTIKQYFALMDKEIDLIDQMKDATREFEQLDSDMNADAGQKGEDWTDADANRYGGELDKLQTKIEKLAKQKAKVKLAIINYKMNY